MFYLLLHNGPNTGVWDVFRLPNVFRQELWGSICFRPPTMEVPLELTDSGLQRFLLRLQVPHSGCFSEHLLFGATQCSRNVQPHGRQ